MSSTSLFKFFFLILLLPIISCQSVERVIDQNFNNEQKIPEIKDIEKVDNIFLGPSISLKNFEKVALQVDEQIRAFLSAKSKIRSVVLIGGASIERQVQAQVAHPDLVDVGEREHETTSKARGVLDDLLLLSADVPARLLDAGEDLGVGVAREGALV